MYQYIENKTSNKCAETKDLCKVRVQKYRQTK